MKKNVVIIHTDEQRYDSLGCSGNTFALTPNIDKLAKEGSYFSRHIATNPICMPSRASLLTGLYPPGHNVYTNGVALNRKDYASKEALRDGIFIEPATMADMFSNAGYDTVSFGKLHLTPTRSSVESGYHESRARFESGELDDWHGPYYGFRYVDITEGHGEQPCLAGHYSKWLRENHQETYRKVIEQQGKQKCPIQSQQNLYPSPVPFEQSCSAWLAKRFDEYIAQQASSMEPFFSFIGFPDPHHPFTPSYDILEKFMDSEIPEASDMNGVGLNGNPILSTASNTIESGEHQKLAALYTKAMVYQIDLAVGRIIETLKKNGLLENTIVIFTSDHGDFLGQHGLIYKSQAASDALLHIPFIIRVPGSDIPSKVDTPMSNCDVLPTLAALTGIEAPDGIHGQNIIAKIGKENRVFAYCADGVPENLNYTVYNSKYRYTWYPVSGFEELFDHSNNRNECNNLAENCNYDSLKSDMQNQIKDHLIKCSNPILGRNCSW